MSPIEAKLDQIISGIGRLTDILEAIAKSAGVRTTPAVPWTMPKGTMTEAARTLNRREAEESDFPTSTVRSKEEYLAEKDKHPHERRRS